MILKRLFDIVFSIVFILAFFWLYIIISIFILIDDGFPILYQPKRRGKNKKIFTCFKFRTMSNHNIDKKFILKTGKILRKSNLDELPQFFNVIIGNMSIVGPRPHDIGEDDLFSQSIDEYDDRFIFKPGITGYAAIKGNRGGTDLDIIRNRINLDKYYIKHYSLFFDIQIIIVTIFLTLSYSNELSIKRSKFFGWLGKYFYK